jgi:hypothetical protein
MNILFLAFNQADSYRNNCAMKDYVCPQLFTIATRYGQDGPGIKSRWGRDFPHPSSRHWGPPSLLYNGYRVFPGGKAGPGRGVNHPPSFSTEVKERVELYLYSTSGPSWPIPGWTLPLPLPYRNCSPLSRTGVSWPCGRHLLHIINGYDSFSNLEFCEEIIPLMSSVAAGFVFMNCGPSVCRKCWTDRTDLKRQYRERAYVIFIYVEYTSNLPS